MVKLKFRIKPDIELKINDKISERGMERVDLYDSGLMSAKDILGAMPELKHDKDIENSEVLAFIGWCCVNSKGEPIEDIEESKRVFNVARNKNCRWIVYDSQSAKWVGSSVASPVYYMGKLLTDCNARINKLNKDVAALKHKLGMK